jgi:hypothetical protein
MDSRPRWTGLPSRAGEPGKEVHTVSRRITRNRNKNGRLRKKRSDAHLKGLEKIYGELSAKRSDTHLGTLRAASGKSLSQMVD